MQEILFIYFVWIQCAFSITKFERNYFSSINLKSNGQQPIKGPTIMPTIGYGSLNVGEPKDDLGTRVVNGIEYNGPYKFLNLNFQVMY